MLLLKVINSLSKFFFCFCLNFTNFVDTLASLAEWPRGFGGFVSFKQILGASWSHSVVTVFAGSWRWQQESGSWRSGPSASSRECPAVTRSNRPSWASHTVSVARGPNNHRRWFADALCVFERLAAENKSTENLSVASDLEATDTPKSKRSAIRSVVDGARRRGWAAQTHQLGKGTQTHHQMQMQSSGFASFSYQINSFVDLFFSCGSIKILSDLFSKCWHLSARLDTLSPTQENTGFKYLPNDKK